MQTVLSTPSPASTPITVTHGTGQTGTPATNPTRSSAATARWWPSSPTRSPWPDEGLPGRAWHAGRGLGQRARDGRRLTEAVVRALLRSRPGGGTFHIEDVQDQVELGLMRGGHHEVARAYVLYRERRTQERAARPGPVGPPGGRQPCTSSMAASGAARPGGAAARCRIGLRGPGGRRQAEPILPRPRNLYDGVPMDEVYKAAILAARTLIERTRLHPRHRAPAAAHHPPRDPGREVLQAEMGERYADYFPQVHQEGHRGRTARREAAQFDLVRLARR
jgi:ribonucleoside-diphosphate reductase alpha chain